MNVCNVKLWSVVVVAYAATASAFDIYTLAEGASDWSQPQSYNSEVARPVAGDVVVIPKDVTAYVTNTASYNVVKDLSWIRFADHSSRIVFEVPDGETWVVKCTIRSDAVTEAAAYRGELVKRGGGDLEFMIGEHTADIERFVYTPIIVETGAVVMPQNYYDGVLSTTKVHCRCGPVTVSNGAYFVTSRPNAGKQDISHAVTYTPELWGDGTISNRCSEHRLIVYGKTTTSVFRGTIGGNVRYHQLGYVDLMGDRTESSATTSLSDGAIVGVKKFGYNSSDSASSITRGSLDFVSSGTFRYLGSGETTMKTILTRDVYSKGPAVFDGGTNGALVLAGTFQPQDLNGVNASHMHLLALTGDHPKAKPCEISGSLSSWTYMGYPVTYTVAKRGTGTWKFSNDSNPWSGSLFVENGTLQTTSVGNIGEACAIGFATNCTAFANVAAADAHAPSVQLDYAICLGCSNSVGTLEYVGEGRVDVTNRPIALSGIGGRLENSTASAVAYHGVSALASGTNTTFTVAGNSMADNIVAEVCDGNGKVSLVKDGDGRWTLGGTNSFSGTLSVRAGTLYVNDPTKYSWFRWVLKERWGYEGVDGNVRVIELGIYDEANHRINGGLAYSTSYSYARPGSLEEGACAIDRSGVHHSTVSGVTYPIDAMFDDGTRADGCSHLANVAVKTNASSTVIQVVPVDASTWIPIVMRLTNGVPRAASFDIVQADNSTNTNRYFKAFGFEGSIDGIHWDVLTNVTVSTIRKERWVGTDAVYQKGTAATHVGGLRINGGPIGARKALADVESVAVSEGARLVSWGDITIHGLTVDMDGAGTIENFSFAERGTLNINRLPLCGGELPGSFVNCTGISNIGGWTLTVCGRIVSHARVAVSSDGRIRILRRGMVVSFK